MTKKEEKALSPIDGAFIFMKNHTKIYTEYFGIGEQSKPRCEFSLRGCKKVAVDVHHIEPRGMGGVGEKQDYIENLMGLCREHHEDCERKRISKEDQKEVHATFMRMFGEPKKFRF